MRISKAMMSAYRNGHNKISGKVWAKLEEVERLAGVTGESAKSYDFPNKSASVVRDDVVEYRTPGTQSFDARLERLEDLLSNLAESHERLAVEIRRALK